MNLHTSFLPFNRGSHPNVWPIIDGTPAGVTLHTMDSEIDKGEIIYQEKVVVEDTDTGKTLYEKLERKSMHVLKVGLEGFYKGDIRPYIPTKEGTYHSHKDFLNLFEIDLEERVKLTDFINKMRALSFPPFKNAFYKNEKNEKVFIDFSLRK
jgi:methionyl-tRNA formyltransferase